MAELHIRLSFELSRPAWRNLLATAMLLVSSTELASESVTLTTYYPAPSGVYTNMITTSNTYLARDAAGRVGVGFTGVGVDSPASKLHVKGAISVNAMSPGAATSLPAGATIIWSDGSWVRINQNTDYSVPSGLRVYTPSIATENLNIGGAAGYGQPGNGEIWAAGHIRTNGRLIVGSLGTPTAQLDAGAGVVRSQQGCITITFAPTGYTGCPGNYYATYSEGFWARNVLYSGSTSGLTSGQMVLLRQAVMPQSPLKSGVSLVEKGDFPRALPHLDRVVARQPDFALGYAWRGLARFQTGSLRGALSDFENAVRLDRGACSWVEPCLLEARKTLGLSGPIPQHVSLRWKNSDWEKRYPAIAKMYEETEYRTASEGLRAIMFRNVAPGDDFVKRARRDKMHARLIFHVKPYEGFSHRHDVTTAKTPGAWAHVVAARRPADADAAKRVYDQGLGVKGHAVLGKLLGFPPCCRRTFEKDFVLARIPDPLFESALRTKGARRSGDTIRLTGHPECNVLLRYFGLRPVSWIPCAFDCAATKAAASRWFEVGRRVDAAAAGWLLELLSQPARWSCDLGRVSVETPVFAADAPSYVPDTPRHIHWRRR